MAYDFVDAQEMRINNPDTFEAPCKEDLDELKVNDIVKVCHNSERFWATVKEISGNTIKAVVDNDLVCDQPFGYGDTIEFNKCNIYSIYA